MKRVTIDLLHGSPVICAGISSAINAIRDINVNIRQVQLHNFDNHKGSIIIADPLLLSTEKIESLRSDNSNQIKIIALYVSALPADIISNYDATISIYDSFKTIEMTIRQLIAEEEEEEAKVLSQREKDVVIAIVKGLSNKEIASEMGVSVNTVMTHRRNIASKLQIHSAAGLTIYAIVSKLVRLDEIKTQLPR